MTNLRLEEAFVAAAEAEVEANFELAEEFVAAAEAEAILEMAERGQGEAVPREGEAEGGEDVEVLENFELGEAL